MSISINFSKASALKEMYEKNMCGNLLEDYDYKSSYDIWKSAIARNFKITKVEKINNPQLFGMYLLWEEEFRNSNLYPEGNCSKHILYHATSPINARNIARSNIDWRKTVRSRFGMGACFSDCPRYADRYASSTGAFVIFEVLTKKIQHIGISYTLRVPTEKKYDTTLGSGGNVYVKYDDYQFYPKFIVYYDP